MNPHSPEFATLVAQGKPIRPLGSTSPVAGPFVVRRVVRKDRRNGTSKKTISYVTPKRGWTSNINDAALFHDCEAAAVFRSMNSEVVPISSL